LLFNRFTAKLQLRQFRLYLENARGGGSDALPTGAAVPERKPAWGSVGRSTFGPHLANIC